jgi:hypothetical protein
MAMGDIEPELQRRQLPGDVARLREAARAEQAMMDAIFRPAIEAHLEVYERVIGSLITTHRAIADDTDLEIRGDTRWSAIWELAGRCLAIARVVLHDLRGGFASEAAGSLRALHEAVQLLSALAFHEEEDAVRRWLAGEYVPPRDAREIQGRQQALALERMREAGIEPEGGDVVQLGRDIYSSMSEMAHHQRGGFLESISEELREFAYGPHPDARTRGSHVDFAGELLEEVLLVVGDAFADILDREYYREIVPPLQAELERIRRQFRLNED